MDANLKTTQFFLMGLFVLSAAFLMFNIQAHGVIGNAFYVAEGGVGFAEPGNYPQEITSINILAWSIVLMVLLAFIITMKVLVKQDIKRHTKKKH